MVIRMLFVASANTHTSSPRPSLLSAASSANSREKCLRPKQGPIPGGTTRLPGCRLVTLVLFYHEGQEIHPHCMLTYMLVFREQIFHWKMIECKDVHMGCDRHSDLWDCRVDSKRHNFQPHLCVLTVRHTGGAQ